MKGNRIFLVQKKIGLIFKKTKNKNEIIIKLDTSFYMFI